MCLAVPGKILAVDGNEAEVDFGGIRRKVRVDLVKVEVGEYVLVHAGYAINTIERKDAEEIIELFGQMGDGLQN